MAISSGEGLIGRHARDFSIVYLSTQTKSRRSSDPAADKKPAWVITHLWETRLGFVGCVKRTNPAPWRGSVRFTHPTKDEGNRGPCSDFEQIARLGVARGGAAELAGGHAGEGDQLAPAERRAGRREFLAGGPVKLLGVERAVLAHGEAQQQGEQGVGVAARLAVPRGRRRQARAWSFARTAERSSSRSPAGSVVWTASSASGWGRGRQREEVAPAVDPVPGHLVGPQDQAGRGVPRVRRRRPCSARRWPSRRRGRRSSRRGRCRPACRAGPGCRRRPSSRRTSWFAAIAIASPTSAGANPSARAVGGGLGGLVGRPREDRPGSGPRPRRHPRAACPACGRRA